MASLYNSRKEQLSGTPKVNVSDVEMEMQKARSQTPKPISRNKEIVEKKSEVKKIAYKHELEDLKNKMLKVDLSSKDLEQKFVSIVNDNIQKLNSAVDEKINENKKHIESLKVENLKNTLNESISKINDQLKNIASQLVSNGDKLNELKVRLEDIESMI